MAYNNESSKSTDFANLLGGDWGINSSKPSKRKGVYANYPAATPKYSTTNDDKSLKTQARLLIPFPDPKTFSAYVNTFNGKDIKQLAQVIGVPARKDYSRGEIGYVDFLLTQAQESFEEKLQIIDVVGDNYVAYFFGQRPPLFSYQGILMNTQQDDWRLAMLLIYQNILRGTQLARRNTMVTLSYDKLAVSGALVNMTQVLTAEMQMAAQFSFQILVKRLDVERTPGSIPTHVSGLPFAVHPDTFAVEVFDVPSATIRVTAPPTYATVTREKESPSGPSFIAEESSVYGAPPQQSVASGQGDIF